jgi:hypothetical protein
MIEVWVGSTDERKKVIVDASSTLREILEDAGINYMNETMQLDGTSLVAGSMDKTLADFNVKNRCYLLSVVKADGGSL